MIGIGTAIVVGFLLLIGVLGFIAYKNRGGPQPPRNWSGE